MKNMEDFENEYEYLDFVIQKLVLKASLMEKSQIFDETIKQISVLTSRLKNGHVWIQKNTINNEMKTYNTEDAVWACLRMAGE